MDTAASSLRNRKQGTAETTVKTRKEPQSNDTQPNTTDEGFTIVPLIQRAAWMRLDVWPFLLLFGALLAIDLSSKQESSTVLTFAWCASLGAHFVLVVLCQWKILVKVAVGYRRSEPQKIKEWTHGLVRIAHDHGGVGAMREGIVPVRFDSNEGVAMVTFQDQQFRFCVRESDVDVSLWDPKVLSLKDADSPRFRTLRFPTSLPMQFYSNWQGHPSFVSTQKATAAYESNLTVLKIPRITELLSEQLLAPFFLFQVFCVALWSLDEYWYYAMFTLFALLMFESTVAFTRQKSLERLRRAGHKGIDRVWVQRGGPSENAALHWFRIPSRELVPGDVVCLGKRNLQLAVPADILLTKGSAVVDEALLTGESTPQLKHEFDDADSKNLDLQDAQHKESVLFAGTVLLSATAAKAGSQSTPLEGGIVGFVLRTGFETSQGTLLRAMAHSSKNADGIHNWDTFVFIFVLVCIALGAAGWVLHEGWYDDRRNKFRLILHVIIIVTSVIPPELPMELSLALTNSVTDLMRRCNVYCTEHFRIPWAGQVNYCCFDKTGTLTSDEMTLHGVRVLSESEVDDEETQLLTQPDEIPPDALSVMCSCHSLIPIESKAYRYPTIVGDPLEKAVLDFTDFKLYDDSVSGIINGKSITYRIHHRFAFSSHLKRMTVLASSTDEANKLFAFTKGAPETMKSLLSTTSLPETYDKIANYHMHRGRRVLAMGRRRVGKLQDANKLRKEGRSSVEKELEFVGFLVLECPIKPDTRNVILELQKSGHKCVMITGDALPTACEVAHQTAIVGRKSNRAKLYEIRRIRESPVHMHDISLCFGAVPLGVQPDDVLTPLKDLQSLSESIKKKQAALVLSGSTLADICSSACTVKGNDTVASSIKNEKENLLNQEVQNVLKEFVPLVSVFARHAPHHKEAIVAALNGSGMQTLMCGDGTNDVGALKRAHVGISIISDPLIEKKQRSLSDKAASVTKKGKATKIKKGTRESYLRQLAEIQDEIDDVELGDASVAAPFTSRSTSIKCCKDVILQGRCTLVTTLEIYKILGVNCLVNAMVLSRLFLFGAKQGERQMTILGFAVTGLFYFVTRAKSLPTLSKERPPPSVLCAQAIMTMLCQCIVHIGAIHIATTAALSFTDSYDPSLVPDGAFNPNTLNSCTFLLTCLATLNTFAVNYKGRPFMEDLTENTLLFRSLQISYAILAICTLNIFPPLNDLLQLSDLPSVEHGLPDDIGALRDVIAALDFPVFLLCLMLTDTLLVFMIDRYIKRALG